MKRPIIAFAHHPWNEPQWMNRQQILSRLGARGWPIVYSSGALDWWQRGTRIWRESPIFNQVEPRDAIIDTTPGRLGARWQKVAAIDRFAIRRHAKFLRKQVASPKQRIVALLFDPQFFPYIKYLQPCDVAFHAYDAYSRQPQWSPMLQEYQAALLSEALLVTASSETIARELNSEKAIVIPNGADTDSFSLGPNLDEPDDLCKIPHPRLGYSGSLNNKVDFPLIATVASDQPDWNWVLVGRVEREAIDRDNYNAAAFRACESYPNVHFLGRKHRSEMPAYVGHMDVNTMCYRASGNGWWNAGSPLKLHEYLATGLPVVSAEIESVSAFSDVISIASSRSDWLNNLRLAISDNSTARASYRKAVAARNSWDATVSRIEELLNEHITGK